jgi:hypothetical protein
MIGGCQHDKLTCARSDLNSNHAPFRLQNCPPASRIMVTRCWGFDSLTVSSRYLSANTLAMMRKQHFPYGYSCPCLARKWPRRFMVGKSPSCDQPRLTLRSIPGLSTRGMDKRGP